MSAVFPLTPFEEFLLREDTPACPSSCFLRLQFSGRLDRDAFIAAARLALERHPLLAATLAGERGRWRFLASAAPEPVIEWMEAPRHGRFPPASHSDLTRECGLRFLVSADDDTTDVVVQYHHATSDAYGVMWFIYDMLLAYAAATGGPSPRLPPLSVGLLRRRRGLGLTWWARLKMAPGQLLGTVGVWHFLTRTVQPLLPHHPEPEATVPDDYPAVLTEVLNRQEMSGLTSAAERSGNTVNDLLARDLVLAIDAWRTRHGIGTTEDWLRLMVPVNLRTAALRRLPAANAVAAVFLDRRRSECHDPTALLHSIHREMQVITRFKLAYDFIWTLELASILPAGLTRLARRDRCAATCILTNLGKVPHTPLSMDDGRVGAGGLVLEGVELVAPCWPHTCAAFSTVIYGGRLFVTLHHDSRVLLPAMAQDLLELYGARLRQTSAPPQ